MSDDTFDRREVGTDPPPTPGGESVPGRTTAHERRSLGSFLNELRPSVATGGWPVTPLVILFALNLVDELDREAFSVLFPEIRDWFGADLTLALQLSTLSALFVVLAAVPIGFIGDRLNRKWIMGVGVGLWSVMTLLQGFAPSLFLLALFRFGSGVGKANEPVAQSMLADFYPPKVRGSVFALWGIASALGRFIAPLLVAVLFGLTGLWQVPFLVFAIPSFVLTIVVFAKLKDPVRGVQERLALGASDEEAAIAERPPGWTESFRIAWGVRTMRRIWFALPFIVGTAGLFANLLSELLDTKFGIGPGGRGVLSSITHPAAIAGLLVGGAYANRLIRVKPARVMTYLGLCVIGVGLQFILIAFIPPSLFPVFVVVRILQAVLFAVIAPAMGALISLVVPPRARAFATGVGALWAAAGLAISLVVAPIAGEWGVSGGMVALAVVFLIGAAILMSAAGGVEADIRAAMASASAAQVSQEAKAKGEAKLLVCRDVDVSYGNVQILFNLDFDVAEGEIVALLGTNGAGKSTLLRAISGLTTAGNGAIFFDGEDITHLPTHEHVRRGVVLVNGGRGVFPSLTVAENLTLAAWTYGDDEAYITDAMAKVHEFFPILAERAQEPAGNLSGGEQQMLCLSQAFLSRPRLLMIDELSLGLAPVVVERLLGIVQSIHEAGTTIVLVEQSVNVALTVAERAVYLEKGEVRFVGPAADLLRGDTLRSVFLKGASGGGLAGAGTSSGGATTRSLKDKGIDPSAPVVLRVTDLRKQFGGVTAIDSMNLEVQDEAIIGLIGPNGAGKTTLFDIISGFIEPDSGSVELFGDDITTLTPDERAKLGLMRSFQDARLFPALTVAENLAVALERHVEVRSAAMAALHLPNVRTSEKKVARRVERLIRLSNLQAYENKFVRELSTGTRRIVDLAVVLAADPRVILLDEPSSGVAQQEAEELGPLLTRIRYETGCAMLLIEHDMSLISSVSDELIALDLGRDILRGAPDDVLGDDRVVASYLGSTEATISRSGR